MSSNVNFGDRVGGDTLIKCSVAAVIRRGDHILAVRRPLEDAELPGIWGLPALSLAPGELPEAGIRRLGREKLGCEITPTRLIGADHQQRPGYRLILLDIEATVEVGEPDLSRATTSATRYVDFLWTADLAVFRPGVDRGSLCCKVLLDAALR